MTRSGKLLKKNMKTALIQTKQNKLYSFHCPDDFIAPESAARLQEEMLEQFFGLAEKAVGQNCDLIVTTEAINFCGMESALQTPCDPHIPCGPEGGLFEQLSCLAARTGSWLVAGVYNKRYDNSGRLLCYNSAYIYDRQGRLRNIYDKIHLAGTENEYLIPGNRIVTVETDMGKMGVAVCYDMQFPDVCRGCKEAGAEFMAVPTWGWEHGYGMERIRETGMKVAAAMAVPYWMPIKGERSPSELIGGNGQVLAAAGREDAEVLIGEF